MSNYTPTKSQLLAERATDYQHSRFKDTLRDLQANILKFHNKTYALHAFIQFYDGTEKLEAARKWLRELPLTSAWEQIDSRYGETEPPTTVTGIYLTHRGYQYLRCREERIPISGSTPFTQYPTERIVSFKRNLLKDQKLPKPKQVHAMLLLAGDKKTILKKQLQALAGKDLKIFTSNERDRPVRGKIGHLYIQWGHLRKQGWFRFQDGTHNPLFFPNPKKLSPSSPEYIEETEVSKLNSILVSDPNGMYWYSCGSYLSFMKLEQDIEAFNKAGQMLSEKYGIPEREAKRLMVGVLPKSMKSLELEKDLEGCPVHKSHVQLARYGQSEYQGLKIARRSINYEDKSDGKGLLFMSFQADLERQFESLINVYFSDRKKGMIDPLLYNHGPMREFNFNFHPPRVKPEATQGGTTLEKPFVTLLKGWYFFAPSISFFSSNRWQKS